MFAEFDYKYQSYSISTNFYIINKITVIMTLILWDQRLIKLK